jgi:hypothetical protein
MLVVHVLAVVLRIPPFAAVHPHQVLNTLPFGAVAAAVTFTVVPAL